MNDFLNGGTMIASLGVALYFLRYWLRTRDRFFLAFATAFAVFAVNRAVLLPLDEDSEARTYVYLLRALMFLLIAGAVVDKNLRRP